MGRKRKASLEVEYQLEREIKDLKQEISKLKKLLKEKEKDGNIEKPKAIKKTILKKECPNCKCGIKTVPSPIGSIELCENACGYRNVIKTKKDNNE